MIAHRHPQRDERAEERNEGMLPDSSNESRLGNRDAGAEDRDDDAGKNERIGATYERRALRTAPHAERSDCWII